MESSLGVLLVLIATLAIIHIAQAQDQQGFINFDCGLSENETSPYKERFSGLWYSSDATLISSGKSGRVQENTAGYPKSYETLRYFPDGRRNCYNILNVEQGHFQGQNATQAEILHIPTSNSLQICLVKTGDTTPLISVLELRPMGHRSYITKSGSLQRSIGRYLNKSGPYLRFSSDVYDRIWGSYFKTEWTQISTARAVINSNDYALPTEVLRNAAIPTDTSAPLTIEWRSQNPDDQYYFYAHFAEIQDLQTNDFTEFNVLWNGLNLLSPLIFPLKFEMTTFETLLPHTCPGGECSLQLVRTKNSTLPPLLNAFEVYRVIQFPQSETDESEVVAIRSIETTYGLGRINWQGDPCVPRDFKWDGLDCSYGITYTSPRITTLNLSSSHLTGTIAAAIQNLTQLEKLDLSNNNLTGGVPEFLGNMKSLLVINLSGNNLNGSIPQPLLKEGLELFFEGNPRLCLSDSCKKTHKKKVVVPIVASVASAAIVIVVLVLFLVLRKKKSTILQDLHLLPRTSTMNVTFSNKKSRRFRYTEVIKMTNNFQKVLGKGGFGMVYHGTVNGSGQVAVKVLSQSSTQGYKEFKAEVDLLLRVHHTNLVSLVGYCYEGDQLALVYEYLPNGDLKQHLSGNSGRSIINWSIRLQIALEAALGLEYLHIGCTPPMVHRDVKTANILLDDNFKAKLADFGLSRSFHVGCESQDYTAIAGTLGYLDPEYYELGRLSEKSDIYSFGIVLLEMITHQPVINQSSGKSHITQWVGFKICQGDITEIMDPNLCGVYDTNSVWRALELAMSCANPSSSKRPTMSRVINELKECIACENSGLSKNGGLESQEMNIILDTSVVPMAR